MTRKELYKELKNMGYNVTTRMSKEQLEAIYKGAMASKGETTEVVVYEPEVVDSEVVEKEIIEGEVVGDNDIIYTLDGAIEYHHTEELLGVDVTYKPLFECDCEDETYEFINKYSIVTPTKRQTFQASKGYNVINTSKVIEAMGLQDKISTVKRFNDGAELFVWIDIDTVDLGIPAYEDKTVGDVVKVGVVIENSYNTNRQFKMHIGSYRLICSNGMISFNSEFTTSAIHRGGMELFTTKLLELQEKSVEFVERIKASIEYKIDRNELDKILQKTEKLLGKKQYKEFEEKVLSTEQTAWTLSNELTYIATHKVKDTATYINIQKLADKLVTEVVA